MISREVSGAFARIGADLKRDQMFVGDYPAQAAFEFTIFVMKVKSSGLA
jgi:hypothetical protein